MEFKVIDASVLLHMQLDFDSQNYIAPNSVMQEILDEKTRILVEDALKNNRLKIIDPNRESLERAKAKAVETGDISALSKADLDVIALALEKNAVVVSDDYAIQNTSRQLGLKTEPAMQDGIKKTIKWVKDCQGCGRQYTVEKTVCDVCGTRLRKKPST